MLAPLVAMLVALAPATTSEAAPPSAAAPEVSADALALAKLMSPRDIRIEGELKQFDLNFSKTMMQNPDVKAIEEKFPGAVDAMGKAARPLLAEETGRAADETYPKMARILAGELTGPEIAELSAYYGSAAGKHFLHQLVESADAGSVYAEALKGDGKVSAETANAQTFIAAFKATGQISAEDYQALQALTSRPVWPKLQAVQPKIQKLIIDAANAPDPAYEKRIEEAMSAAIKAHIRSFDQPKQEAR